MLTIFSSVKWLFLSLLGIAYLIVYTEAIPQQEIAVLSIVGSGTVAFIVIIIFMVLETKFQKRRGSKQETRLTNLEDKFYTETRMLRGTIKTLEMHTDQATFEISSVEHLLVDANENFIREFGWTIHSLNNLLTSYPLEERIAALVKLLFRMDFRNDIRHLITNRLENGNIESAVRKDIWMQRQDMSDFSADMIVEVIKNGNLKIKGFIKNTEEEKHREATEESVYGLMVLLRDHFSEQKQQDSIKTRRAMVSHLDKMRRTHDGKLR